MGQRNLFQYTSAQISGVSYKTIGDAGLEFLEELSNDAHVRVPSTLNPAGVDLQIWKELGFSEEFTKKQLAIVRCLPKNGCINNLYMYTIFGWKCSYIWIAYCMV